MIAPDAPTPQPRRLRVMYVYHGTVGIAGAYLHGLACALTTVDSVDWRMVTSHYYAFPTADPSYGVHRLFFRFTEITDRNPWLRWLGPSFIRLAIRYVELTLGYARSIQRAVRDEVDVVNLSVIDDELPTLLFAWAVKALGLTLCVTAHDVVMVGPRVSIRRRKRVLALADHVFVHYEHVRNALAERLGVTPERVITHPFPWTDVSSSLDPARLAVHERRVRADVASFTRTFLFLGVVRHEKGLDTLLDAWSRVCPPKGEQWGLMVAGRSTPGCSLDQAKDLPRTVVYDRYLTSEEFWAVLQAADVVVLPYRVSWYAHSSVSLMAALAGKPVIASRIPLFERLVFPDAGVLFEAGDPGDLVIALERVGRLSRHALAEMGQNALGRLTGGWRDLPTGLAAAYDIVRRQRSVTTTTAPTRDRRRV